MQLILIACALFYTVTWATSEFDFGPRFESKDIQVLTPTPCTLKAETAFVLNTDEVIRAHCGKDELTITGIERRDKSADEKTTTHVRIQLIRAQQQTLSTMIREPEFPADFVDCVSMLDLNGDGKSDYIIDLSSHGNGLAANMGGVLLLLSQKNGYRYVSMEHLINMPNRFLRFNEAKTVVMVLQRLYPYRLHNYFVFDLIRFPLDSSHGARSANGLDNRFPFWALYTDKQAHTQTNHLSPTAKRTLWRDPISRIRFGIF
ncbi:MAG: hypothetical protein PHW18_07360 [Sulfuricurvum sp.]|uniref:hypothetical protein n=1 Tax=Sulfuricurvum sp. TaxID=2025608 RepID=UPI00261F59D0|nr:hypothetical protein [Sulfuricurvum sp.]MDD2829373.1 hypothetical protein [Sulfuricurvum sp.]MDD4949136.1 hypothetical protein [Sulfuricurvum sp.]